MDGDEHVQKPDDGKADRDYLHTKKKKLVLEKLKHNTLISNLQPPEEERAFT